MKPLAVSIGAKTFVTAVVISSRERREAFQAQALARCRLAARGGPAINALDQALAYASQGRRVFPCKDKNHPRMPWRKDASTDPPARMRLTLSEGLVAERRRKALPCSAAHARAVWEGNYSQKFWVRW